MFILPAFNQTIQRLAGPGLGHNTRHVYVGDGIGDVVRPLISAGVKAAARLAAKGLAAARNLGVDLFHAAKPLAMHAATEAAEIGKDILRQRAQDLFVPAADVGTTTRNLGVQAAKPRLRQAIAEAGKSILRQRAQELLVPAAAGTAAQARTTTRATIQQRAQDLLTPRVLARATGPRKRQRATIQQKARELLSGRVAKNLDTLIWGRGYVCLPIRAAVLGLKLRWSSPTSAALFSTYCRRPSAMRVSIRSSGASMSPRNPTPENCCSYG